MVIFQARELHIVVGIDNRRVSAPVIVRGGAGGSGVHSWRESAWRAAGLWAPRRREGGGLARLRRRRRGRPGRGRMAPMRSWKAARRWARTSCGHLLAPRAAPAAIGEGAWLPHRFPA